MVKYSGKYSLLVSLFENRSWMLFFSEASILVFVFY